MCGRFGFTMPKAEAMEFFHLAHAEEYQPGHNLFPATPIAAILLDPDQGRVLRLLRWGLVPAWNKEPDLNKIKFKLINARAETAADKPSFRNAFAKRRCLIPASMFYEWQTIGKAKQPLRFTLADNKPFAMAGLWERWISPQGEPLDSCTILTTQANALVSPIHDRMPVILGPDAHGPWMSQDTGPSELAGLLVPYPAENMAAQPVNKQTLLPESTQASLLA